MVCFPIRTVPRAAGSSDDWGRSKRQGVSTARADCAPHNDCVAISCRVRLGDGNFRATAFDGGRTGNVDASTYADAIVLTYCTGSRVAG
jgi:hypothetical protein